MNLLKLEYKILPYLLKEGMTITSIQLADSTKDLRSDVFRSLLSSLQFITSLVKKRIFTLSGMADSLSNNWGNCTSYDGTSQANKRSYVLRVSITISFIPLVCKGNKLDSINFFS